jgi:hypothetical protein
LIGTPAAGEVWTVALDGIAYAVVVGALVDLGSGPVTVDTPAEIALALARAISADLDPAAARFVAAAEGAQLVVVNRDGAPFATSFQIARTPGASVDTTSATSAVVTIGAGLAANATATLVLHAGASATSVNYQNTTAGAQTAAQVAAGLGALIDGLASFTATADGAQVVIVSPAGTPFTIGNFAVTDAASATATLVDFTFAGTAVTTESWTLTVAGKTSPTPLTGAPAALAA